MSIPEQDPLLEQVGREFDAGRFDAAEEAARSIGIAVWSMDEYEADDGLASGARRFRDEVEQVRILTPDKDLPPSK